MLLVFLFLDWIELIGEQMKIQFSFALEHNLSPLAYGSGRGRGKGREQANNNKQINNNKQQTRKKQQQQNKTTRKSKKQKAKRGEGTGLFLIRSRGDVGPEDKEG